MTTESREKALPGYRSLADVQKRQVEQNDTIIWQNKDIIELLGEQLIDARIGNDELNKINVYKEEQKHGDRKYRSHDVRMKRQSTCLSLISLTLAIVALTISIKINGVQSIFEIVGGVLLWLS